MIKSGGFFFYKGKRCIIGAVISLKGLPYMVTVSHIFRGAGDHLIVDGMEVEVTETFKDFDLALIKLPPECMFKMTELGNAVELEEAFLVNDIHVIRCRVVNAELHYFIWALDASICRSRKIAVLLSCRQGR